MSNPSVSNLISAAELIERGREPGTVIIDCRFNLMNKAAGREAYLQGHIPGAVYADLDQDLAAPVRPDGIGGRHPLPDPEKFGRQLRSWGVGEDSRVIAYDDVGGAVAVRLWWLLGWLGHRNAALLDGGLPAWLAAGGPLSTEIPEPASGTFTGQPGSLPVIEAGALSDGLSSGRLTLLDARDAQRFSGATEPLDKLPGHVPGAVNTPLTDNLDADKCFRPAEDLQAYYRTALDARPAGESIVCMCGSGVTACHTLFALELAGIRGATLYTGSWSDWISTGERPIATDNE